MFIKLKKNNINFIRKYNLANSFSSSNSKYLKFDDPRLNSKCEYRLVQNKPTFYPKWNACFDCHLYTGRTIQIIINNSRTHETLAEVTVSAESLASKAKDMLTYIDWVCLILI